VKGDVVRIGRYFANSLWLRTVNGPQRLFAEDNIYLGSARSAKEMAETKTGIHQYPLYSAFSIIFVGGVYIDTLCIRR